MNADAMRHAVSYFSCLFALTNAVQLVRHRMRWFIIMGAVSQVWYRVSALAVLRCRRKQSPRSMLSRTCSASSACPHGLDSVESSVEQCVFFFLACFVLYTRFFSVFWILLRFVLGMRCDACAHGDFDAIFGRSTSIMRARDYSWSSCR
ncbi:hypothetical protein DFH08DRAFT_891977 [Mycena albidolilacea]|uniref:Transmembrane protein n=1 Tax=Mycena albidolilacea TaxID=1033008 RepID=A0AAD7EEV6_9AGAR|nr:hypothetical protein DFH08DRAFT_891977 [Mycena albidolilacea]